MYQEALLGVLLKLCDDVFDKRITVSPVVEETLKALVVVFLVLLSSGDFYFASGVFFLLAVNPKTDTSFWKAMIPVSFVLMVMNYRNEYRFGIFFVYMLLIASVLYIEDRSFPEEVSTNKSLSRVLVIGLLAVMDIKRVAPEYLVSTGTKAATATMFYLATSVLTSLKSEAH